MVEHIAVEYIVVVVEHTASDYIVVLVEQMTVVVA